jgi:hypothetical protein
MINPWPVHEIPDSPDHDDIGITALAGDIVEHQRDAVARQRKVDEDRGAFAGAIVLEVGRPELAATGQRVLDEIHRPALVGSDRTPVAGHRAGPALLAGATADRQALFLVEPGNELVIGAPALTPEQLVQPSIAETTILAGKGTKPLTQLACSLGRTGSRQASDREMPTSLHARRRDNPCSV